MQLEALVYKKDFKKFSNLAVSDLQEYKNMAINHCLDKPVIEIHYPIIVTLKIVIYTQFKKFLFDKYVGY